MLCFSNSAQSLLQGGRSFLVNFDPMWEIEPEVVGWMLFSEWALFPETMSWYIYTY